MSEASDKDSLPWGVRFRYRSSGKAQVTRTVVRAAVRAAVPDWEIRAALDGDGWFEAVPRPLPDYVAAQPPFRAEFAERFAHGYQALKAVSGVCDAAPVDGTTRDLMRAFLADPSDAVVEEFRLLIEPDPAWQTWLRRWRRGAPRVPLLSHLLEPPPPAMPGEPLERSAILPLALRKHLEDLRDDDTEGLQERYRWQIADVGQLKPDRARNDHSEITEPLPPQMRQLRAYAFDPTLATTLKTEPIHQVTIPTRWEDLKRGPVGEYLEVVDVDPASGCAYLPVDLDHRYIVAQDGLSPSEGNPQFHQQMVYAVAMNTIQRFELALNRPVFWSPLRPWLRREERLYFPPECKCEHLTSTEVGEAGKEAEDGKKAEDVRIIEGAEDFGPLLRTRYVQRLRIYPHALREANAYYSPIKRALSFGYFPSAEATGGMVFTCLSHDIIVHETTHAIVDGMHPYFNEPSNDDVWAFHEAFADIMALFQHFTYPEVLRHQIASTRGDLETENLLGELAQQFGQATGDRRALRSYLGTKNDEGEWKRTTPDPEALQSRREPHHRGSILVAAVFDAFIALYKDRVSDLMRIATGGTGVLPAGSIHPDLAARLAREAARAAEEVLLVCIRAMDYLPPVDVTFGEFLRALITADYELSPVLRREKRVAFIDAFRSWGIYPREVTTLSEESLLWRGPEKDCFLQDKLFAERKNDQGFTGDLAATLEAWRPGGEKRQEVFCKVMEAQERLFRFLQRVGDEAEPRTEVLPGLDLRRGASFNVDNMRPARRIGSSGEFFTEMIVEVVQNGPKEKGEASPATPLRGGATLIIDLQSWQIRYIVYKRIWAKLPGTPGAEHGELSLRSQRLLSGAKRGLWRGEAAANLQQSLAATYSSTTGPSRRARNEPFAFLHRGA